MAAAAEPLLMTVEQYRELPAREDVIQELHWGQVVILSRPKMRHTKLHYRLVELLRPKMETKGIVAAEVLSGRYRNTICERWMWRSCRKRDGMLRMPTIICVDRPKW